MHECAFPSQPALPIAARLSVAAIVVVVAAGCAPLTPPFELHGPVPPPADAEAFDIALFQTTGAHLRPGHRWRLEDDGRVFAALVDDIGRARASVDIVSYIWHSGEPSDRILAALQKRVHGVACRILADPLGSPDFAKNVAPRLRAMGCATALFRPLGDHALPERNHRKLAIVDGRIGYVGGFGVRHEWVEASGSGDPEWRDINLRLDGPAAADLQRAFAQNWQEARGELLPADDFPRVEPDGDARVAFVSSSFAYVTEADRLTLLIIAAARKRLWLWNAYFAPDEHLS
ncbi:MAG TPA: phospholipase D-like domain-containing protein, partial [Polyangia bacterium]